MKIVLCKGQFLGPISGADETLVTYAIQLQRLGHAVSVLLLYPCAPLDHHYLRLCEAGVPVVQVASHSLRASLLASRRILRGLVDSFPSSQRLLRSRAQRITTTLACRYQQECCDSLKRLKADVVHVVTPDSGAMVMIRAAYAAGIPVVYQELGIPYQPPDFESYYEQFTTVLPLCAEIAALSPLLAQQCRAKLTHSSTLVEKLPHNQLYPIVAGAHLVVLPSLMDNLPNACLEAMTLGKPVIGTLGTSFDELVIEEETGFLVRPNDAVALAEKIIYAWAHPRLREIGQAAQGRMREFAPERTVESLLTYYREILAQ